MKYILSFLIVISTYTGMSQVNITASVNRNVMTTGDQFYYEVETNSQANIKFPSFNNFRVLSGPNQSTQSSYSIINGKTTAEFKITYTFVLQPKAIGKFNIPAPSITDKGRIYKGNQITIQVSKDNTPKHSGGFDPQKGLTARMSLSKKEVYVGEPVYLVYRIYTPTKFQSLGQLEIKSQEGVYTNEIDLGLKNSTYDVKEETINGHKYSYITLKKELLIPSKSGDLKLEPFNATAGIYVSSGFFAQARSFSDASNSPSLKVKPLPGKEPKDFNGAVGKFDFNIDYSTKELKVNEGIDITVTVSGEGNIKLIGDPVLEFPSDFDVDDPETDEKISINSSGMKGKKVYKYFVVPRVAGNFEMDDISFSYFDLASKSYKTLDSEPTTIKVLKADGTPADNAVDIVKKDVEIEKDILHINESEFDLEEEKSFFFGTGLYWFSIGSPILALLFLIVIKRNRDENKDELFIKSQIKKANKTAVKSLSIAKSHLDSGDTTKFYESTHKSIYDYLKTKFRLESSQLNKNNIREVLNSRNVTNKTSDDLIKILSECEMARYATIAGQENEIYNQSLEVIKKIEEELK